MKQRRWMWVGVMSAMALAAASLAWADDDEHEEGSSRGRTRVVMPAAYQQECAACHMAYPPGMLPASSWRSVMTNLPKHYGSDASLDAPTVNKLSAWLVANAAPTAARPEQDRITRTGWFLHEHDEISVSVWKRASIKSAANCMACHAGADKGDFNEHRVRIPR